MEKVYLKCLYIYKGNGLYFCHFHPSNFRENSTLLVDLENFFPDPKGIGKVEQGYLSVELIGKRDHSSSGLVGISFSSLDGKKATSVPALEIVEDIQKEFKIYRHFKKFIEKSR